MYPRIFLSFVFGFIYSCTSNKVWIIRHCDKPIDTKNPCCSDSGYKRSLGWANYFQQHIEYTYPPINIITSNYNSKNKCIKHVLHERTNCQKSQRMFLTTHYLSSQLSNLKYEISPINIDYCIGDNGKVFDHIQNTTNKMVGDTIII